MKKYIAATAIILLFLGLSNQALANRYKAGFSVNYYKPSDSNFKEPYRAGNMMFGLSLGINLLKRFEFRGELNYFRVKGEMTLSKEEITYIFTPLVAGLRYKVFKAGRIGPYLGLGADLCSYKEKVPERYGKVSGSKIGLHGEIGTLVKLAERFHLDINVRYLYVFNKSLNGIEREFGGLRAGIGIEFLF